MQNGHSETQHAIDHLRDILDTLPHDITPEQYAAFLHEIAGFYSDYIRERANAQPNS